MYVGICVGDRKRLVCKTILRPLELMHNRRMWSGLDYKSQQECCRRNLSIAEKIVKSYWFYCSCADLGIRGRLFEALEGLCCCKQFFMRHITKLTFGASDVCVWRWFSCQWNLPYHGVFEYNSVCDHIMRKFVTGSFLLLLSRVFGRFKINGSVCLECMGVWFGRTASLRSLMCETHTLHVQKY